MQLIMSLRSTHTDCDIPRWISGWGIWPPERTCRSPDLRPRWPWHWGPGAGGQLGSPGSLDDRHRDEDHWYLASLHDHHLELHHSPLKISATLHLAITGLTCELDLPGTSSMIVYNWRKVRPLSSLASCRGLPQLLPGIAGLSRHEAGAEISQTRRKNINNISMRASDEKFVDYSLFPFQNLVQIWKSLQIKVHTAEQAKNNRFVRMTVICIHDPEDNWILNVINIVLLDIFSCCWLAVVWMQYGKKVWTSISIRKYMP